MLHFRAFAFRTLVRTDYFRIPACAGLFCEPVPDFRNNTIVSCYEVVFGDPRI